MTPMPKCKQCTSLSHFQLLSKILEHVLYDQIYILTDNYGLLSPHQSGFRSGYSTQDVLLHVTDRWLRTIDENKYTGAACVLRLMIIQFYVLN